jgi:hypothetical protein
MIEPVTALFETLYYSENDKLHTAALLRFLERKSEDFGWVLELLCGSIEYRKIPTRSLKQILLERVDAKLFELSQQFVGQLPDVIARLWVPEGLHVEQEEIVLDLRKALDTLQIQDSENRLRAFGKLLDESDEPARWLLLRLAIRQDWAVSKRVIYSALGQHLDLTPQSIESRWYAVVQSRDLINDWLSGGKEVVLQTPGGAFFDHAPVIETHHVDQIPESLCDRKDGCWYWVPHVAVVVLVVSPHDVRAYSLLGDEIPAKAAVWERLEIPAGRYYLLAEAVSESIEDALWLVSEHDEMLTEPDLPAKCKKATKWGPGDTWDSAPDRIALFIPRNSRSSWHVVRNSKTIRQFALLYYQPMGNRDEFTLTLGLRNGAQWVSVLSICPKMNTFEVELFDDWRQANKKRKTGPVFEVNKTLVVEVAYEAVRPSNRKKSGLAIVGAEFRRFRWETPVETLEAFEKWNPLGYTD